MHDQLSDGRGFRLFSLFEKTDDLFFAVSALLYVRHSPWFDGLLYIKLRIDKVGSANMNWTSFFSTAVIGQRAALERNRNNVGLGD